MKSPIRPAGGQRRRPVDGAHEHSCVEIIDTLRSGEPRLVVLSGPAHLELPRAVATIRAHAEDYGMTTVNLSFNSNTPFPHLAGSIPALLSGADPATTVVVLEEVQRLTEAAPAGLEGLARQIASTGASCLATVALPVPARIAPAMDAALGRLSRDRAVRHVTLRPLPCRELTTLVTTVTGAKPEAELVSRLWQLTRGWPAATTAALRVAVEHGLVRIVDQHAYQGPVRVPPRLADTDELVLPIRRLGSALWVAAKAASVLAVLGPATTRLLADALGVSESEARRMLSLLEEAGVLRHCRATASWRFRLPLVELVLPWAMGPFERRRLAQLAVSALWDGTAPDPGCEYLPDQLVNAGRMVEHKRAKAELLVHAGRMAARDSDLALLWLRAAAELTSDTAERTEILLRHARLCLAGGTPVLALRTSETLLCSLAGELGPEQRVLTYFVHLSALRDAGDTATLKRIADEDWLPWPGEHPYRTSIRGLALILLNRWREASEVTAATPEPQAVPLRALAALWLGAPAEFDDAVAALPDSDRPDFDRDTHGRLEQAYWYAGALLTLGDLDRAERLLCDMRLPADHLRLPGRALLAAGRGRFDDALELARKSISTGPRFGSDLCQTGMYQFAALILATRGKL
ncbi:LigA protein, partial [Kutzneria sp. 744]